MTATTAIMSDAAKKSRYRPVSVSPPHNAWDNSILDQIWKEFQLALLARDGFPAKVSSLDRPKNLKQLLVSAKKVLEPPMYKKFKPKWTPPTRTPARSKCSRPAVL